MSALKDENKKLAAALEPFAAFAKIYIGMANARHGNYPTSGAFYAMETKDGYAEISVEALRTALSVIEDRESAK